jgi:hypothetical protein
MAHVWLLDGVERGGKTIIGWWLAQAVPTFASTQANAYFLH